MRLLLVIPSYRDSARLRIFLPELCRALEGIEDVAVQVVDDGSGAEESARTRDAVESVAGFGELVCEPLVIEKNRGKGGAIYAAWDAAPPDVEWLGFVDADGATPAAEVSRLVRIVLDDAAGSDVVVGSRIKMMGRTVDRGVKRHLVGRIFATLAAVLTGLVVYDSQCGCKFLKTQYYRKVRSRLFEERFAFDMDLLANLAAEGATMRECPVDWRDIPGSKVSILRDGWQMFFALLRLKGRLESRKADAP